MSDQTNWYGGFWLILLSFVVGAGIGLFFYREDFWGGYDSWRRRLSRLGHIALAALGLLNIVYSMQSNWNKYPGLLLLVGGVAMPAVCFLSAWKKPLRHLFFIPVSLLLGAVILILFMGR